MDKAALKLDRQLAAVRRRWIVRDAVLAISRFILAVVPFCLLLGWLDYCTDFPHALRFVALAALVFWTACGCRLFVIPLVARRRDACAAALRVESVHGRFGGRLVSRVEFRGPSGTAAAEHSAGLVDAMCRQVEDAVADLDLAAVIDMTRLRRPAAGAVALLALACLIPVARPGLAGIWLHRTLLPLADAPWPRRTHIVGVQAHYRVRQGDRLSVTGTAMGHLPARGEVMWRRIHDASSAAQPARRASFDIGATGRFTFAIGPLLEPVTLAVEIGDARLDGLNVEIVRPPQLASIESLYRYPPFTQRHPARVASGDVRALVGTTVDLTIEADRPVERMELVLSDGQPARTLPVTLASETRGQTSFVVRSRGRYEVWLYDRFGFAHDAPATFVIEPVENEWPEVSIARPGPQHTVTPATVLRLRFEASDDYGVTGAEVRWQRTTADTAGRPAISGTVPIAVCPPQRTLDGRLDWDLAALELQPGDVVEYHLEVHDAGDHLAAAVGTSGRWWLAVVDPDTLKQYLDTRLREAFDGLDALTARQQAARDAVAVAILSLAPGGQTLRPLDVRHVHAEQNRQAGLMHETRRLAVRFAGIADELRESSLDEPGEIERLDALATRLDGLAAGPMRTAAARLEQARAALSTATLAAPQER